MRAAIYYTPGSATDLARLAATWLGRDAFTGEVARAADPWRDARVAEPARYGFHATLKAPFRLAAGTTLDGLSEALAAFCAARAGLMIRRLVIGRLGGFLALVPAAPEPALGALEAEVVRAFEPFRAPLTAEEVALRHPTRLTARQRAYLERWGYPFVLDEFRFHMTLTGSLADEDAPAAERALADHFGAVLDRPLLLEGVGLFVEGEAGVPFRVHAFHLFGANPPRAPEVAS